MLKKIVILFNLFLINLPVLAQEIEENEDLSKVLGQNHYEPNYFSMIFGLIVVVALVYLTGIIYQKLLKIKLTDSAFDISKIKILSTTSLGQNKAIHIIQVENQKLLIGSTPQSINLLKELSLNSNEFKNEDGKIIDG